MKKIALSVLLVVLFVSGLYQQTEHISYYSQKIMLENTIKERINEALSKILDEVKYIVDVNIELEYKLPESGEQAAIPSGQETEKEQESESYLPLPGFESPGPAVEKKGKSAEEGKSGGVAATSIPVIKRQVINVLLEEGVSPDIIESVREVVAVASHFDKSRGDELIIKTAPFKAKRDQAKAEALILKNIAEKIDEIDRRQKQIEEKAKLEEQKKLERQRVVQDSLKIAKLEQELQKLKEILATQQLTEAQRKLTEDQATAREKEIETLKAQLEESNKKLKELEKGLTEQSSSPLKSLKDLGIYIVLGILALLLILVVILLVVLRRAPKVQEPVPPPQVPGQIVPPQPQVAPVQPVSQPVEQQAPPGKEKAPEAVSEPTEDVEQQREEMKSIKQSVISMSVGQPETASKIINEWLKSSQSSESQEE